MKRIAGRNCVGIGPLNLIHQIQLVWLGFALLSATVTAAWLVMQW